MIFPYEFYQIMVAERRSYLPLSESSSTETVEIVGGPEAVSALASNAIFTKEEYAGDGALGFALLQDGSAIGAAWYWHGERYRTRRYLHLPPNTAKLVQVVVQPEARGKGFGSVLISRSTEMVFRLGFDGAFARVWHSNAASIRAFEKGGWSRHTLAIGVRVGTRFFRTTAPVPFRLSFYP